jgi:uncharacterized glyoxalase superfamily protein PhnB
MASSAAGLGTFRSAAPQFTVKNVVQTAEYYRDAWGFTILGYFGEPPVFAMVGRDGVELYFSQATGSPEPRTGRSPVAYDAYLHVTGVDALATELRERGATLVAGPTTRIYGMRELVVRDCNGLIFALGEEAATPREADT